MNNALNERVQVVREAMKRLNLSAFIITSTDIHSSEYVPECFADMTLVSGFTGSAGTLVVLLDSAHFFTDGRYWLQAQRELIDITLQKQTKDHTYANFLAKTLKKGELIGINAKNISINSAKELKKTLKKSKLKLKFTDLVGELFTRAPLPKNEITAHSNAFVSLGTQNKLALVRQKMKELNATHHFISSLDDIAWISNLRGCDIAYNPVFLSFLLIDQHQATLFVSTSAIKKPLVSQIKQRGFTIREYESVEQVLSTIKKARILLDTQKTSIYFARILKQNKIIKAPNPSTLLKIQKNAKELKHIKKAMVADGVALCEFFAYFNKAVKKGLNELDIERQITAFRAKHPLYICNSFANIVGFNANSALPHYKASEQNFSKIQGNGLLLIDSGAHYQNGTTDITRVVSVGKVQRGHKRDYTLVLKSLIALSRAKFPKNTALPLLDSIARSNLWQEGLEYMHGTGHGVGYCLCVHEMPVAISHFSRHFENNTAAVGVISSIEPGIYRVGKWGVRLENLVAIKKAKTKEKGFGEFLHFETLTLCPFERSLINLSMLDSGEKMWLNRYHQRVFKILAPELKGKALAWLRKNTAKV